MARRRALADNDGPFLLALKARMKLDDGVQYVQSVDDFLATFVESECAALTVALKTLDLAIVAERTTRSLDGTPDEGAALS